MSDLKTLSVKELEEVFEGIPVAEISKLDVESGIDMVSFLNEKTNFLASNGEARRALKENSISINKEKVTEEYTVTTKDLVSNEFILLQRGKKNYFVVRVM